MSESTPSEHNEDIYDCYVNLTGRAITQGVSAGVMAMEPHARIVTAVRNEENIQVYSLRRVVGGDDTELSDAMDWLIDNNVIYLTFIPIRDGAPDFPNYEM
jgi:hypothetical protein